MALLDRDGQSRDQPRDFIELIVVVVSDGACEPNETLLIAHRRCIPRDDRWYRVIAMDDWHQITSRIEPAELASSRIKTFWRLVSNEDVFQPGLGRRPRAAPFGVEVANSCKLRLFVRH